ncbi:MAG: divergent PAP2 family protein [Candidatus Omnitrophota bacterium]
MSEMFIEVSKNKVFIVTIYGWIIAQTIKVIIGVIRQRRFDFRWLIGTGGMPSSHAAGAASLATILGLEYGFDSAYFALAASFAIVVMFDAQGVRRSTGKQARILNNMMEDIYWKGRTSEGRLLEFIGHTPVEVFAGALLGVVVAFWLH